MFFFLSKFLPLFCYPLGLTCGLMVGAIVVLKRWPRVARGVLGLAVLVLWGSSTPWAAQGVVGSLERPYWAYAAVEQLPSAEAIVILGGATAQAQSPRVYPEVLEAGDRLFQGARLYGAGKAPWVVLSGGRVQWPVSDPVREAGSPLGPVPSIDAEAVDMATLLRGMGVPDRVMLLELRSLNTYQNALYTAQLLRERGIREILLVTSAFHMARAQATFQGQGLTVIPAPTDFRVQEGESGRLTWQQWVLNLLPDVENQGLLTLGLKEWLGIWVYRARGWL
ncbi:MAG: YdcF family protein [Prochlorothrix sp.]